jgi:PIN domain nuclease of toxin-antitoxin system
VNFLLDTNALLWLLAGDARLSDQTGRMLADPRNQVYVSAVSAWEMAIKVSLGKLSVPTDIGEWLPRELAAGRLTPLPISLEHAAAVEHLPPHHADPFDRLLIAQARVEDLTVVTADSQLERYEVRVIRC